MQTRPHRSGTAGDLSSSSRGAETAAVADVHELPLDCRRQRAHQIVVTGTTQNLAGQESGPVDTKKHPAYPAGSHGLDIYSLWQYRHLAATHQRDIARLLQHRLTDREQDDHDPYTKREPQQEEQRASLSNKEVT